MISRKTCHTNLKKIGRLLPFLAMAFLLWGLCTEVVFADDYLAGALKAASDTFGDNTQFQKLLYLAEACGAFFVWIKTKSPMAWIGLPILMLASHFFLGLVSPA